MTDLPFGFQPTEELPGGFCSKIYATETQVLKVPWQGEERESGFVAALRLAFAGGVAIMKSEPATGAVLMPRIVPGTGLDVDPRPESARIEVFVRAVREIQGLSTEGLMPLMEYLDADPLRDELLATSASAVFLHGDLHHENLLLGPDGEYVVIDPKGLVGDPCFEAAAWLRNPYRSFTEPHAVRQLTLDRLETLEREFGWDPRRMVGWTLLTLRDGRDDDHPWSLCERVLRDLFDEMG